MKKCEWTECNNLIDGEKKGQKYCCDRCSSRHYWHTVAKLKKIKKVQPPRVCYVCGATFTPRNPGHSRCHGPECEIKKSPQQRGRKLGTGKRELWKKSLGGLTPAQALAQKYGLE